MIQRREDFGFALEPHQPLGVCRNGLRQDLDRDLPLQVRVSSAIHLTHAAHADLGGDFIGADTSSCYEGHGAGNGCDYTGMPNRAQISKVLPAI